MNGNYRDESEYGKRDVNPMATGLLGAVAGAAIGIALASILSDPQKRKRVGKQIQDFQKWGNKTLQDLRETSMEVEETVREQADELTEKAEKMQKGLDDTSTGTQPKTK